MHGRAEHFRDQKPAENANENVKTRQVRPRCEIHLKNPGPQCQSVPNGGNLSENDIIDTYIPQNVPVEVLEM